MIARKQIFVSSVQKELADERRALKEYVHGDPLLRRFILSVPATSGRFRSMPRPVPAQPLKTFRKRSWPIFWIVPINRVENRGTALPFQVIETIREGRATREPGRTGDRRGDYRRFEALVDWNTNRQGLFSI